MAQPEMGESQFEHGVLFRSAWSKTENEIDAEDWRAVGGSDIKAWFAAAARFDFGVAVAVASYSDKPLPTGEKARLSGANCRFSRRNRPAIRLLAAPPFQLRRAPKDHNSTRRGGALGILAHRSHRASYVRRPKSRSGAAHIRNDPRDRGIVVAPHAWWREASGASELSAPGSGRCAPYSGRCQNP